MKRMKREKGITLIALVVTIIVMIILAGVSITLILSDNGIFQKAKETKIIQSKAEIYEDLILKKGNVMDDSMNIKLEDYMNNIEKPGIKVAGRDITAIEDGENENMKIVTIDNKYVYSVAQKENDIVINEIGYVNKLEPIIRYFKIEEETTSSVTVKIITKMAKKYELYIAEEGQEYEKVKEISKTLENYNDQVEIYTYSKLTQGTKYKFKIIVKNDIGQKEQEIEQELGKVPDITLADITVKIEPNEWTNQDVTATVKIKDEVQNKFEKFILQTSKDGITWERTASQTYSVNGTIYVRIIDSTNQEGASTSKAISNIDKTVPTVTSATSTTNTVTVVGTDEGGSNVTGYALTTSTTKPALSSFQTSGTFTGKTQGTTYYAWVRDGAGNISAYKQVGTKTVTGLTTSSITVSLSPSGWTNQNVTATVSVNSGVDTTGFTLQTSTNGTSWASKASQTYSANGTIYARLIDSTGQEGASTSKAIENIDKTAPGKTTVNLNGYTSGSWTNGNITQTFSATDTGGSGIAKYQYSHDKVNIGADLTSSWTINWDGQWTFYIRAVDAAGNAGAWSDAYIIRRSTGTPSVPTITYNGGSNSCSWKNNYNLTLSSSATSGISYYEIDVNSDGTSDGTCGSNFIPSNGWSTCTARFRAVDNAGNRSGWTDNQHIHMYTAAPSVPTITYNGGANTCSWKNNYNLTLSSSSPIGIAHYEVDWNSDGGVDTTTGSNFIPWNGYSSCTTRFRAVDNAGNRSGWTDNHHIHMDTSAPTGSGVEVRNLTTTGYDVYVYNVSDGASGINRVQFPTWTTYNGQDDIQSSWWSNSAAKGTQSGTTWVYHVNISSHNDEAGDYNTHVYVYDNAGNSYCAGGVTATITARAQVGDVKYNSVGTAINHISSSGTVKLISDTTEWPTIPAGKNITLNLNGYTSNGRYTNNGTFTVTGSGYIKEWDYRGTIINNGATVTINGGNIQQIVTAPISDASVLYGTGTFTVNGGTFEVNKAYGSAGDTYYGNCVNVWNNSRVTINGGTFNQKNTTYKSATNAAILIRSGTCTISNATVSASAYSIYIGSGSNLNLNSNNEIIGGFGVYVDSGFITVNDGTTIRSSDNGISVVATRLTMNGGKVRGTNQGIHFAGGTVYMYGGDVKGGDNGAVVTSGDFQARGGKLTGKNWAIYAPGGSVGWKSGIILESTDGNWDSGRYAIYAVNYRNL